MTESGVLDGLIRCRAAARLKLIHGVGPRKTTLDGDGAITMCLHQALEGPIAEGEQIIAAVERFSETEQLHGTSKCRDDLRDGRMKLYRGVDWTGNRFMRDPVVDRRVEGGWGGASTISLSDLLVVELDDLDASRSA